MVLPLWYDGIDWEIPIWLLPPTLIDEGASVRIVHWGKAKQFIRRYPAAEPSLRHWKAVVSKERWKHFMDITATFRSADKVGEYTVFDIAGNNFRLIAIVAFVNEAVYIREILTHEEYDENKWRH